MAPYVSRKQEEFFNANRSKLESQGVSVDEWNKSSKGIRLPLTVKKKRKILKNHIKPML